MIRLTFPLLVAVVQLLVVLLLAEIQGNHLDGKQYKNSHYEAPEPFPDLFGFDPAGNPPVPLSPDPLVPYTWDKSTVNASQLQVYRVHQPVNQTLIPSSAVQIHQADDGSTYYTILDSLVIQLDWGVERAAWFEFILSADGSRSSIDSGIIQNRGLPAGWNIEAALSEFNTVYPGKKGVPIQYNQTYRLETNKELYEGIRFTWLYFTKTDPSVALNLTLSGVSLVAKVKPISYQGAFASSNDRLTQTWYRGAYGVRLNMEGDEFNSILLDRGDRVAIQGDGHPTMATALLAFGNNAYSLVLQQLWKTNSGHVHGHDVVDDSIMAYPLYWVGSVLDWYWATGDHDGFAQLVPDVLSIVNPRIQDFLSETLDIGWMGWDDRLGNGWCFHYNHDNCPREGHLTFAALVVKVVQDVGQALCHLPNGTFDKEREDYRMTRINLTERFRSTVPEYPKDLGVHAAANAISSGIATPSDIALFMNSTLNDAVTICSWSAFNQYWILQGFSAADQMELAIESIEHCWGNMLDTGKGCFFELSSPEWPSFRKDGDRLPTMPSMCHPWASGVTAWMSSALAGIRPIRPGYSTFLAAPYVSMAYPQVNGTVPTPFGSIRVEASWHDGKASSSVLTAYLAKPKGSRGYVGFRRDVGGCRLNVVDMGGKRMNLQDIDSMLASAKDWTSAVVGSIKFVKVPSGLESVAFTAGYSCNQHPKSGKVVLRRGIYPATVSIDRNSQGDGLVNHGSDGYLLLGADKGKNVQKLPNYIASINIYDHGFGGSLPMDATYVGSSDSDPAYLPFGSSRSLGILGEDDDTYWNPGIVVDVNATARGRNSQQSVLINVNKTGEVPRYKLSLYCVAKTDREQFAIRVMDLSTLNVVAPTKMIEKHQNGVWWTVEYESSIRLRIMGIYGMHISALAFSTSSAAIHTSIE
jgi:alpha-L-rhamnosidase